MELVDVFEVAEDDRTLLTHQRWRGFHSVPEDEDEDAL